MKSSKVSVYVVFCSFICPFFFSNSLLCAQESLGKSIDCTEVSVNYSDDGTLTREERLRLMDKAFLESLNKFDMCQSAKKTAEAEAAGAGGGGGEGAGGGAGNNAGGAGNGATGQSVASSSMSGTDAPKEISSVETMGEGMSDGTQSPEGMQDGGTTTGVNKTHSNGKLPEDIPPADNDDALAAQIRYAAENETDPVKKEQLWNEYRKYKGLAPKK